MAFSYEEGTANISGGTETNLNATNPNTTEGVYQLFVDLKDMVNGNEVEIRIYEKARTADTNNQVILLAVASHAQAEPMWVSPSFVLARGWRMTLKQTSGSNLTAVSYSIRNIA